MLRRDFLRGLAATTLAGAAAQSAEARPNILFVLMDDLGWSDLGPYGNKFIDTPNLDRFARESARFTDAYAACPVCSPTRASIMTGKYPARLHLTDWIPGRKPFPTSKLIRPEFELSLPAADKTIAEILGPAGYRTAAIGKWHLGGDGHLPTDRGFGTNIAGNDSGHPPAYFGPMELPNLSLPKGESLTARLTEEAIRFISAKDPKPFFLYLAHYTVHTPLQAPAETIAKYKSRDIGDFNATYCAMVESADDSMGQILKALDDNGLAKKTIVIFFSDNGAVRYQGRSAQPISNNAPLRAGKGHLFEGGIREPLMIRWPGVSRAGSVVKEPVSSIDFLPTLCQAAGVALGPVDGVSFEPVLRGDKLAPRPLFWHYPHYSDQGGSPGGAIREGEWKLIEFYEDGRLELFHLTTDPGERVNLVNKEPARAKRMHGLLSSWRKQVNAAMPQMNPKYDPAHSSERLTGYEPPTPPA